MIDEDVLREEGITDFDQYAYKPGEVQVDATFQSSESYLTAAHGNSSRTKTSSTSLLKKSFDFRKICG